MAFYNRGSNRVLRTRPFVRLLFIFALAVLVLCLLTMFVACGDEDSPPLADDSGDGSVDVDDGGNGGTDVEGGGDTQTDDDPQQDEKPSLKTFDGVTFEDESVVYDGNSHIIAPKGMPFGTTVTYLEKKFVDVGTYQVVATLKLSGYETTTLFAMLTILPAEVHVQFQSRTFVWDGTAHSLYVEGDLPADAVVTYDGNDKIEVGDYTVTAHVVLNKNYVPVEDLTATLSIQECTYVVSFEHWDGTVDTVEVYRGHAVAQKDIPANKQKDGYYQMVWDPDELALLDDVRSDITVHEVEGETKTFYVILNPNGGIVDPSGIEYDFEPLEDAKIMIFYTVEDDITLPAPFKRGDTFIGWYDEQGRLVTKLPDGEQLRNMTLTARWESDRPKE